MESLTTSPLDGTISKLAGRLDSLLRHGCILPKGVEDEIPLIKQDLEKIVSILSNLQDDSAMMARCWRKEVRELSYDLENFIDQYEHAAAAADARSWTGSVPRRQRRSSKTALPWLRKKLRQRLWMANKIREFSVRAQEALRRHSFSTLDAIAGSASTRCSDAYSTSWYSTPSGGENYYYVGIDAAMEKLEVLLMMNHDEWHQKLKVVSIVGFGGIGKTTLANELYRKLGLQFECCTFVRTSQRPDMRRILISMLSQVCPHRLPDNWAVHSLISTIRTHLQDKRYLIVVEDLRATSTWDILKLALPDGNCCSRILLTTEIEDLALQSCGYNPKYVVKMKPLGEDDSRKLFFSSVFGPQDKWPPELKEISCDIIRKCGGLPLAIVTIASIFAEQLGRKEKLDHLNKSLGYCLITNPTFEGIKQVLDISYNNLPQHLKACILYTSLYEEDILIWRDDLVNQWIAEGFISATGGKDKQEIARAYFDELVGRKMIQPVYVKDNGEVLCCMVHHMVLNRIISKSIEENFVTVIHHSQATTTLPDRIHRLSLQYGNAGDAMPPTNMRLSQVRTLAYFGVFGCMPSIVEFRLLQVLILHLWGDKDCIILDLTRISELFRLQYLKVSSNVTLELHTHMQGLQSLETLTIDARVKDVPSDIVCLPGLLHLNLPEQTNLPNGIVHMTSLQTLGCFDLSTNMMETVQGLGMLTNLRDLRLTCSTVQPEILNDRIQFLVNSILGRLTNINSLTLVPSASSYANSLDDTSVTSMIISGGFSSVSYAPTTLQSLKVSPRICIFFCTPDWIGQLHKLSILKIGVRKIDMDGVDILGGLPALAVLSLHVQTKPAERIVIGKTGFPVIKYLKFRCCHPWLKFEKGAMPNLRKLKFVFNACNANQQSTAPVGIRYLSDLKELSAKMGGAGPDESQRRAAELAFRDAISVPARCQRVNIHCVKHIIGGMEDQTTVTEEEYGILKQTEIPEDDQPDKGAANQNIYMENTSKQTDKRKRMVTSRPDYLDYYRWRKYGSKGISGSKYPRVYYRCTHGGGAASACMARKQVQRRDGDPPLYDVIYKREHSCDHQPTTTAHSKITSSAGMPLPMLPLPPLNPVEAAPSSISGSESQGRSSEVLLVFDDIYSSRKDGLKGTLVAGAKGTSIKKSRSQVSLSSAGDNPVDDGHSWRKYGQKDILGARYPRGYYRCAHRHSQGCVATKQVQRTNDDPALFDVTNLGDHTCLAAGAPAQQNPDAHTLLHNSLSAAGLTEKTTDGPQPQAIWSANTTPFPGDRTPAESSSIFSATSSDNCGMSSLTTDSNEVSPYLSFQRRVVVVSAAQDSDSSGLDD